MAKLFVKDFIFQPKRQKAAEWTSENPILRDGEFGVVTDGSDGKWLKVGDGVTAWNSLPYKKGPKGDPFTYSDFTPEQLAALKGEKGDAFTYEDFTAEQLASLKGKDGADGKDGTNGKDGYTPQKGVDYFTDEDIVGLNIPSVDQAYDPTSENAQSGKVVKEAVATEQKRADNTFANALKGSKSGSAILIDDVSPVTHDMGVKISSDTVTDLTAVKVKRQGKNLMPYPYDETTRTERGITATDNGDGSITFNGTATSNFYFRPASSLLLMPGVYTLSGTPANLGVKKAFVYIFEAENTNVVYNAYSGSVTFTVNAPTVYSVRIVVVSGITLENETFKIQLELNSTVTEYEPYITTTEYTPTADGTVNGVTSLYPNTTLTTDTEGVIIDCEYNKDINKFSGVDVDVPTKTSELINDSNFATQDYVDEEIANFDFIKIVTELPETGLVNRTYFVPKQDPNTNDLYDEYMWVDGKWELITTKQIEVDLTGYVKHTDINQSYDPTSENAQSGKAVAEAVEPKLDKPSTPPTVGSVLKVLSLNEDGTFTCEWADNPSVTDVQINGLSIITDGVAHIPITKSNWSEASGYVLRRTHIGYGLAVLDGGTAAIYQATKQQIDGRSTNYNPIAPSKLDYAVKAAMCDGKGEAWTDTERIAALLRMGCTVDDNGFVKWAAQEVSE